MGIKAQDEWESLDEIKKRSGSKVERAGAAQSCRRGAGSKRGKKKKRMKNVLHGGHTDNNTSFMFRFVPLALPAFFFYSNNAVKTMLGQTMR